MAWLFVCRLPTGPGNLSTEQIYTLPRHLRVRGSRPVPHTSPHPPPLSQAGPDDDVEDLKDAVMEDMQDIFASVDKTGAWCQGAGSSRRAGSACCIPSALHREGRCWVEGTRADGNLKEGEGDGRRFVPGRAAPSWLLGGAQHRTCCLSRPPPPAGEGVCVQASTLGSLEALLEFLRSDDVQVWAQGRG